ncbi:MAG TPA: methyltransferase domain-containing protein [Stellaceae bacterium]|jgi:SAM-dependent methyltransferase|nr:methyltransferase domain-containing protein [Stellaceae bacterium]
MEFDPETIRQFEHQGWERAAAAYGETFAQASGCYVEALLDAGRIGAGTRLLDLACGTGLATAAAARRGAEATGRDFSAAMLAAARVAHPALRFDQGDAEALPYPQAAFDAVVSNFGMHHFPHPDRAAAAALSVLRPGGVFAFTSWAEPAHNVAWRLLFDAVRAHGDPDAAKAPPSGGGLARVEAALAVLCGAGFDDCEAEFETREWQVADPADLVASLRRGTVRTAALIEAQDESAMPAILAHIARAAAPYRRADGFAIPIVAVLARGTRA